MRGVPVAAAVAAVAVAFVATAVAVITGWQSIVPMQVRCCQQSQKFQG